MRDIIDRACRERGWSHAKLAQVAGISPVGLCRILRKGSCYMSSLVRICQALDLRPDDFNLWEIPGLRWTAKTELGQQAQWLARNRGWTDADLAQHAGLSLGQVESFMCGIASPRSTINAIEKALGRYLLDPPDCPAWITQDVCARAE